MVKRKLEVLNNLLTQAEERTLILMEKLDDNSYIYAELDVVAATLTRLIGTIENLEEN